VTTDPRAEYTVRLAHRHAEIAAGERRHQFIANLRLLVVGLVIIQIWLAWTGRVAIEWFGAPLVVFVALAIWHERVFSRIEESRRAGRIYERGLARIDGTWMGSGADGARFSESAVFAPDLDLFGPGSLFQLLNTIRTEVGEEVLAEWLIHGADPAEVRARQAAVDELRPMVDFREALAMGAADGRTGRTAALARWASMRATSSMLTAFGFIALSLTSVFLVVALFVTDLPVRVVSVWLLVQIGISALWARRAAGDFADLDDSAGDLAVLRTLLERFETQRFASPRLAALRDALPAEGALASRRIAALERLVTALDSCGNPMVAPVAKFLQIPAHVMMAIARWRAKHGHAIAGWLRAVGEAEAFAALSAFAFENPSHVFPEIDSSRPQFQAIGLAHPLLRASVAVPNDVRLGGLISEAALASPSSVGSDSPHVLMVSGSNMSGKSTLLRAVGVNTVLALAGAPVRAAWLRLSPVTLGVSLRVEDSLQGGQSKFYAEILRVRSVVDLSRGAVPLLFLLDEILAGTNSFDRRIGAEAVIKSLARSGAIGLVTTHDLALTELVPELGVPAANVHFEDRIEDGQMVFDYTMRPGVVERSNAIELMRTIGIDV
jgi:hypothetical protein